MQVGKKYIADKGTPVEAVCQNPDKSVIVRWPSSFDQKTWCSMTIRPKEFEDYEEFKESDKVYCSVWNQKSDYKWILSGTKYEDYNRTKTYYLREGYELLKEWVLEY